VRLTDAEFEKDGKTIPYRKAGLTSAGEAIEVDELLELVMKDAAQAEAPSRKRKKGKGKARAKTGSTVRVKKKRPEKTKTGVPEAAVRAAAKVSAPAPSPDLEEALRKWRMAEAKLRGVPAFRIFSDQALSAIATRRPSTAAELLAIPGMGIGNVEKYGAALYRLLAGSR